MLNWLSENLVNIVIIAVLVLVVGFLIRGLVRDHKAGKSSCGGNCASCGGCGRHASAAVIPEEDKTRLIQTRVGVEGMMCGMCEAHVNDAVRKAIPVKKVSSSHAKGETLIITEGVPDAAKIRQAIDATGSTVSTIDSKPYIEQ